MSSGRAPSVSQRARRGRCCRNIVVTFQNIDPSSVSIPRCTKVLHTPLCNSAGECTVQTKR